MSRLLSQLVTHLKPQVDLPDSFVQSLSPQTLTEAGKKMLDESGLKNTIDTRLDYFKKKIESKRPPTNYDKEQLCYEILLLEKNQEYMNPAKEYAFNKGIDLLNMLFAASIYLRDLLIKEQ